MPKKRATASKSAVSKNNMCEVSEIDSKPYLYPLLEDPLFNVKIATKKEFYDTRYVGDIKQLDEEADRLCNADFELSPHQLFVRNFMSFATPYNSLLLYHGLGSGKTCSAIGVAEEMRAYLNQMSISQRIIIVASPNVQDNFRTQLFDPRKLKLVDGMWNIRACTGNRYLKEVNPMSMKGLSKEKVIRQVRRIINNSYLFLGYIEFANYISKLSVEEGENGKAVALRRLKNHFDNRLVIIDEVHNIRISDENKDKKVAVELMKMVSIASGVRLLLLSATPMYNSYREIVWLINLMNKNDRRSMIEAKDVFDSRGNFKVDSRGVEVGKELLERKATGYISFVRGENPYAFPYRIFPDYFSTPNALESFQYPRIQLNGKAITQPLEHINVFITKMHPFQTAVYERTIEWLRSSVSTGKPPFKEMPNFENMDSFGYTMLQRPLEALNIVYPIEDEAEGIKTADPKELVGKIGLSSIVTHKEVNGMKRDFKYRKASTPRVFDPAEIGKYSAKISNIVENVKNSTGIVLIYSQYIEGGLIPIALALESLGVTRYSGGTSKGKNLFAKPPTDQIDAITGLTQKETSKGFRASKYVMITGDKSISPNNLEEVNALTSADNINGEMVKVVLISQAGSEGLDFVGVRQVHVLEPWYNMNRIEQIIGRAVRWCSHKKLPFSERNVQIFLYGSQLDGENDQEAADLYVYRLAESKAVRIGHVSRLLKQISVDCLLNTEQTGFTVANINQTVKQVLSDGKEINYPVGDKPYSAACDYLESCSYQCKPCANITQDKITLDTFDERFILMNTEKITQRIRQLMKERFFYAKEDLIARINVVRNYPLVQINAALTQLIEDDNEYIMDMFGRAGRLINRGDLYLFQPLELKADDIPIYERKVPVAYKHKTVAIPIEHTSGSKDETRVMTKKGHSNTEAIVDELKTNVAIMFDDEDTKIAEKEWYVLGRKVRSMLRLEGFSDDEMRKAVIGHALQMLDATSYVDIMNLLLVIRTPSDRVEKIIVEYLNSHMLKDKSGTLGQLVYDKYAAVLYVKRTGLFELAESEDLKDFSGEINKSKVTVDNLNSIVGFISVFKNEYRVFKTKQMEKKRHKGARCDQAGKAETLRLLNKISDSDKYSVESTKETGHKELCVLMELLLRLLDDRGAEGKRWFISPAIAVESQLEKMSFV